MTHLKQLLIGTTAALAMAASGPVWAQAPAPRPQQAQLEHPNPYPFNAATPEDAYRQGLINRWQYEQYVGPLPQAMMGPSVDGDRGGDSGGGGKE